MQIATLGRTGHCGLLDRRFRLARKWSNSELMKFAPVVTGSVINVSGWRDSDKEGRRYKDYFANATEYRISNFAGTRGTLDGITDIELDLTEPLPEALVASADAVFNHTTLEHIFDVHQAFTNLCSLTRDLLIVVVPFVQEEHFTDDYGDYWRFTPQALSQLAEENGLKTVMSTWNNDRNAASYIFFVASRLDRAVPDSFGGRNVEPARHPGEWVGRSRIRSLATAIARRLPERLRLILKRNF